MMAMTNAISEVLLTERQIQRRVQELGAAIAIDYTGLDPVLVGVLRGVVLFMADLMRAVPIPFSMQSPAMAHRRGRARSSCSRTWRSASRAGMCYSWKTWWTRG